MHFAGALLCSRCGIALREERTGDATGNVCPRCSTGLFDVRGDSVAMQECAKCGGVFVDHETIGKLATDPARRGEARAGGGGLPARTSIEPGLETVRYVKCPVCQQTMNRKNYSDVSGVIVDVCRADGVWFDAGELTRVVEFIEQGGLERARRVRDERSEEARRQERVKRIESEMKPAVGSYDQPVLASIETRGVDGVLGAIARFLLGAW